MMKIEICDADTEKRNGKVERASVHRTSNQCSDALDILVHQNTLAVLLRQRPQSIVGVAEHFVVRTVLGRERAAELRAVDDVVRELHRSLEHEITSGCIQ